jgi:hypothetical protein
VWQLLWALQTLMGKMTGLKLTLTTRADLRRIEILQRSKLLTRSSPMVCCHRSFGWAAMHFNRLKRRELMTLIGGAATSPKSP